LPLPEREWINGGYFRQWRWLGVTHPIAEVVQHAFQLCHSPNVSESNGGYFRQWRWLEVTQLHCEVVARISNFATPRTQVDPMVGYFKQWRWLELTPPPPKSMHAFLHEGLFTDHPRQAKLAPVGPLRFTISCSPKQGCSEEVSWLRGLGHPAVSYIMLLFC